MCRESLTSFASNNAKCILKMSLNWTCWVSCKKGKFRHTRYNWSHLPWRRHLKDTEKPTSYKMRRKAQGKWDLPTLWLNICTWDGINLCYLMCVCEDFCTIFRTKSQNQYCKMNNADIFKLSFVFIRRHKFLRTQKAYFSKKNIKVRSTILD